MDKEKEKEEKKREKEREKIEKDIERIDKEYERKDKERDKEWEKEIGKLEKGREERERKEAEREGRTSARELQKSQRQRLHDLFGQIEKEFDILWEENQELRKKLDGALKDKALPSNAMISKEHKKTPLSNRLNVLKKKNALPEWEHLTHFMGHRDGIWEVSTCKWVTSSHLLATASCVYIYVGHKGSVNSARFHPSSRMVCSASGDGSVHIWKFPKSEKSKEEKETKTDSKLSLPWTPLLEEKEKDRDKERDIIKPSQAQPLPQSPSSFSSSMELHFPPGTSPENEMPSSSTFGVVTLNRSVGEFHHQGVVSAAEWTSGGEKVVSGGWDNSLKEWSVELNKFSLEIDAGLDAGVMITNVTSHSSHPLLLVSSSDSAFRLWDLRASQPLQALVRGHTDVVNSAIFCPTDENLFVSGSDDRTVKVWDRRNLKTPRNFIRCSAGVNRFSISPLSCLLSLPLDNRHTKVCDLSGNPLGRLRSERRNGHTGLMTSSAWSSDESVVFTAAFDRSVIAWATPSGAPRMKKE